MLSWLVLSAYHLIDFLLWFTPFYGVPLSFWDVPLLIWADISKMSELISVVEAANKCFFIGLSITGFLFVIYFYKRLVEIDRGEIERERLSNVDELNITGVNMEAY